MPQAPRGITDILLTTALTMSFVLLALHRWRLPFGAFTFMLGINGALMVVFSPDSLLVSAPTALLGGLAADILYRFLQPSLDQPTSVRLFAFLVPAMFYALYFIKLYPDLRHGEPGIKAKTNSMQSATDFHHLIPYA